MLDDPAFVYSFEEGDYVYFVFRETAVEVNTEVSFYLHPLVIRNTTSNVVNV